MAGARKVRDLTCDESFRSAAGKIIWTRFDEMMAMRDAVLKDKDIEDVHDMRVASRRLRAAVEGFSDAFPRKKLRPLLNEVKEIADTLGQVRDLDVMLARLAADRRGRLPAQRLVLSEMIADMQRERIEARKALAEHLDAIEESDFSRRFLTFIARETA